ncbi:MAG TPA: Crp/Fnr family transcriptional regulator [Gammaproteobacteria bacterium]|nr:Crp/Fnr family transcriptional regulator [Gammaproteobacteria bacterium]
MANKLHVLPSYGLDYRLYTPYLAGSRQSIVMSRETLKLENGQVYSTHCKAVLSHAPLFAGLDEQLLDEMLSLFRRDIWQRGVHLDPGIFQERFFLLIDGRVEIMRVNPETGRSLTLFILGPGDGVDMMTLLDTKPHEMIAVALEDVALISVPLSRARSWIEQHPAFNRNFLPYLGEQMRQMEDLATTLVLHDTMTRLARLILRHIVPSHPNSNDGIYRLKLIHDLHDEGLARMVGSVRQVVNRHLQHWRKQGILRKRNFQMEVAELEALQAFADEAKYHVSKGAKTH